MTYANYTELYNRYRAELLKFRELRSLTHMEIIHRINKRWVYFGGGEKLIQYGSTFALVSGINPIDIIMQHAVAKFSVHFGDEAKVKEIQSQMEDMVEIPNIPYAELKLKFLENIYS